jgi:putative phosphoesterase
MMRTIGAISDTHGLLRPQALAALAGCDPIIHAGDIGNPDVLARLGALAPVYAVRGNVDHGGLEREPTCDAADRDRWLPHLRVTHSGRAIDHYVDVVGRLEVKWSFAPA